MCNKEWQTCDVCGKKYIDEESDICPRCQDELYNQLADVSIPQDTIEYQANGIVFGRLWGGGLGAYRAQDYAGFKNLDDLKEAIKKDFESADKLPTPEPKQEEVIVTQPAVTTQVEVNLSTNELDALNKVVVSLLDKKDYTTCETLLKVMKDLNKKAVDNL